MKRIYLFLFTFYSLQGMPWCGFSRQAAPLDEINESPIKCTFNTRKHQLTFHQKKSKVICAYNPSTQKIKITRGKENVKCKPDLAKKLLAPQQNPSIFENIGFALPRHLAPEEREHQIAIRIALMQYVHSLAQNVNRNYGERSPLLLFLNKYCTTAESTDEISPRYSSLMTTNYLTEAQRSRRSLTSPPPPYEEPEREEECSGFSSLQLKDTDTYSGFSDLDAEDLD